MEEKITAWIARDENIGLFLFLKKPKKYNIYKCWDCENEEGLCSNNKELNNNLFPEVKWEDDEPTEVELTIKICK